MIEGERMNKENKITKKDIIVGTLSFLVIISFVGLGIFIINVGLNKRNKQTAVKNEKVGDTLTSRQVVKNFLLATGNMGSIDNESYSNIRNGNALDSSQTNRMQALKKARHYVADTSLYMQEYDKSSISDYASQAVSPMYFSIPKTSILIGQPNKIDNIAVHGTNGKDVSYQAVKLEATFMSNAYLIQKTGFDTSWKGTFNLLRSQETYRNVPFTLIKENNSWRIFDIGSDSVNKISTRFATWQPEIQHKVIINYHKIKTINKGGNLSGTEYEN